MRRPRQDSNGNDLGRSPHIVIRDTTNLAPRIIAGAKKAKTTQAAIIREAIERKLQEIGT